jgi:hypothetical protein
MHVRETQARPHCTQDSSCLSLFLGVLQSTFEALMDQFEADDSLWVGIVESSHPKVGCEVFPPTPLSVCRSKVIGCWSAHVYFLKSSWSSSRSPFFGHSYQCLRVQSYPVPPASQPPRSYAAPHIPLVCDDLHLHGFLTKTANKPMLWFPPQTQWPMLCAPC